MAGGYGGLSVDENIEDGKGNVQNYDYWRVQQGPAAKSRCSCCTSSVVIGLLAALSTILLVLTIIFGALYTQNAHPATGPITELRVLFVGNSLTWKGDIPAQVSSLLQERFGLRTTFASVAISAHFLYEHLDDIRTRNSSLWLHLPPDSVTPKWDYVIFQEQSQVPGMFAMNDTSYYNQSMQALQDLAVLAHDHGAKVMLMSAWAHKDQDTTLPELYPDYPTMQSLISQGYNRYATTVQNITSVPMFLIPVGSAFHVVYNEAGSHTGLSLPGSSGMFESLYADDTHESLVGGYLASMVIASSLTGKSMRGVTYMPSGVTSDMRTYLQDVAYRTVFSRINVTDHFVRLPWK